MKDCLTTPQHEKQIGYWVSEWGKCMKQDEKYKTLTVSNSGDSNIIDVHVVAVSQRQEVFGHRIPVAAQVNFTGTVVFITWKLKFVLFIDTQCL